MSFYAVEDVTQWTPVGGEPLGSKTKVWLQAPDEVRWLFKAPRALTGDDWAEKIAAELRMAIGLPCPRVDLARLRDQRGSITRSFLGIWAGLFVRLVHGNELLSGINPDYPRTERRRVAEHTVDGVFDALARFNVRPPLQEEAEGPNLTALEVFTGTWPSTPGSATRIDTTRTGASS